MGAAAAWGGNIGVPRLTQELQERCLTLPLVILVLPLAVGADGGVLSGSH